MISCYMLMFCIVHLRHVVVVIVIIEHEMPIYHQAINSKL